MKKITWFSYEPLGLICLVLTIVSVSVAFTINFRWIYILDIDFLHIEETVAMNKAIIIDNFDQLMHYLNNPFLHLLSLPDFSVSENGAIHFHEVKRLFMLCYAIVIVTILPSISFVRYLIKNKRLWRLIKVCTYGMAIPIGLIFFMLIGFDRFFILFHGILFNNDNWLFNPATDPIIIVLPEMFFMHCFVVFFIVLESLFLIGVLAGKRELKSSKAKEE